MVVLTGMIGVGSCARSCVALHASILSLSLPLQLLGNWQDAGRGSVPLAWAVDPNLSLRFPPIFDILYDTATPGVDVLVTGDSGAGYNNRMCSSSAIYLYTLYYREA